MRVLIEGFGGVYAVDDEGVVWSSVLPYKRDRTPTAEWRQLRPHLDRDGYLYVYLRADRRCQRKAKIHQLIFAAFHGELPDGHEINHDDGVKRNNRPSNLVSCTHAENMKHAWANGLVPPIRDHAERRKTHCPLGHPYDAENTYIHVRADGRRSRNCRTCVRDRNRRRREVA